MSNFRPIAMRCTPEQFNAIKPKLTNLQSITMFTGETYLTNNLSGEKGFISNVAERCKRDHNREVHEEWNEEIFLKACGIVPTLQDRLANLEKEIEEVKALIEEENKPKIGDICKFWDDDKSRFIIGKLGYIVEIEIFQYCVYDGIGFKNCMKITDENFLKAFDSL